MIEHILMKEQFRSHVPFIRKKTNWKNIDTQDELFRVLWKTSEKKRYHPDTGDRISASEASFSALVFRNAVNDAVHTDLPKTTTAISPENISKLIWNDTFPPEDRKN